ncbi:MAG: hypothetical protein IKO95_00260 [Spirochaetia bacterium]|nr:hypothetical protein [Spirochaetia bacterium]
MMKILCILLICIGVILICMGIATTGQADVGSLSIRNASSSAVTMIKIIPSKAGVEQPEKTLSFSEILNTNEIRSFDLDNNYFYEIQLVDAEGRFAKKSNVRLKYSWQRLAFTDADFGKSGALVGVATGHLKGVVKNNPHRQMGNTCALIIWNRTGSTIDHIDIEQDGERQQYRVTVRNGQQKTIDIRRHTETNVSLYSSKFEYAKKRLIFESNHDFLVFSQKDCCNDTVFGILTVIFESVGSKVKGLFAKAP